MSQPAPLHQTIPLPAHPLTAKQNTVFNQLNARHSGLLTNNPPLSVPEFFSARYLLSAHTYWYVLGAFIITSLLLIFGQLFLLIQTIVLFLSIIYLLDTVFSFWLAVRALRFNPAISIPPSEVETTRHSALPTYTILCPMYHEWPVAAQFLEGLARLDYPKDKLQVLILLEADDLATQQALNASPLPAYVSLLIVPRGLPQTKPRACNAGLLQATGEYLVVYDAEDIPAPDQLLKAVAAFRRLPSKIICLQSKLDFYNTGHSLLTRLFAAEYAHLFNIMLPGLQSINGPIPLGGTSNHFLTSALRQIGAWDPYNVTEDCDLGIRLFRQGYHTAVLDSITYEEANSKFINWVRQRSRWIKGYLQTFIVHTRSAALTNHSFYRHPHFITFILVVGIKTAATFINPLLWLATAGYFFGPRSWHLILDSIYPAPLLYIALIPTLFGNFMHVLLFMLGAARANKPELIVLFPLVPFYWLAMSLGAWRAAWQLVWRPHYWEKTTHGFHLLAKNHKHAKGATLL